MPKYVMLPPIDDDIREWAARMREEIPGLEVVIVEDEADAPRELADADGAYGWVSPEVLPNVERLRLLQNPFAGPPVGWYYPELAQHAVTVSNPRGIYSDHIAHHILMYMLALSRGLPYYAAVQAEGRWDNRSPQARLHRSDRVNGLDQRRGGHRSGGRAPLCGLWLQCDRPSIPGPPTKLTAR